MSGSPIPRVEAASGADVHRNFNDSGTIGDGWSISGSGPWLLAVMLSLIIMVTACGNILLIALVFAHRSLRCTSNCFLMSLFLSDLMVALVVMPPAMLNVLCGTWVLAPGFCPVWLCFDVMCCSASILNLCVISLDRYLLIISPLRYKQHMTPPRALLLVGGAWGLAALTSFLPIKMDWHSLGRTPSTQCRLRVTLPFALVATFLTFFLPSTAICFTYCRILLAARRQARQVEALTHPAYPHHSTGEPSRPPSPGHLSVNSERRLAHRQRKRALKASLTLGVLLGLFFSAWLPFFITNMAQAVCECVPPSFFDAITWLGYCNSTMNPIIYPMFMRDFKRALARLLPCCSSSQAPRRPSLPLSLSLRNSGEPQLPTEPPSLVSDPPQLPATATDAVNLLDAENAVRVVPVPGRVLTVCLTFIVSVYFALILRWFNMILDSESA
uniref:5-hydroxytryptamine receptor 6 n=1 Tax=Sinocyclocheilus grahami TaxID=75366 RepID=A0A672MPL8_SINGR